MNLPKKFLPPLFFAIILSLVIWQVEPPESFFTASPAQLLLFFIPFLLFLTSLINLYTKFILKSLILSLGLVLLLVLKALNFFNLFTIPAMLLIILFIAKTIKKPVKRSTLSKTSKTPPPVKPRWLKLPEIKPETFSRRPKLSRIKNPEKL